MKLVIIISILVTLYICATPCIIKNEERSGSWDSKSYKRKIEPSCECSPIIVNHTYRSTRHWTVFIKLVGHLGEESKQCIGTIVTSNLIATSHKCLQWEGAPTNFFDSWSPKMSPATAIRPENVLVSAGPGRNYTTEPILKVIDIIYHARYLESVMSGKFPENDIALLKVSDDLLSSYKKKPVCVPTMSEAENLLYVESFYYGRDPEQRYMRELKYSLILPGSECDKTINKGILSGKDTVCLKFVISGPMVEGGALITRSKEGLFYLTGLASWVGNKHLFEPNEWKFAYFSHVKYFLKYLEYQAKVHGSSWCQKPAATFDEPRLPSEENLEADLYLGQQVDHKETLKCVCGHRNAPGPGSARILNGETAIPFEFGWMVKIIHEVHNPETGEIGEASCGGSIINDRIILTAAHCIWDPVEKEIPPASRFRAFVRAHLRRNDPDEIEVEIKQTIVHPGYIFNDLNLRQFEFDIALLLLAQPLPFPSLDNQVDKSIVPICLPRYGYDYQVEGKIATVAGWGVNITNYTDYSYPFPPIGEHETLQKLAKIVPTLLECKEHMGFGYISDNYICGSWGLHNDSAQGDSGGALMIPDLISGRADKDRNHHWIQHGIVSFADTNLTQPDEEWVQDLAAIYTKVQNFLSFINFYSNKHGAKWCKFETE